MLPTDGDVYATREWQAEPLPRLWSQLHLPKLPDHINHMSNEYIKTSNYECKSKTVYFPLILDRLGSRT